ncbi:MAG: hypothetical protein EZS28_014069 [Streblomastix strix]|uniref:Uncharacterized protein n=1 Tax=Streblomastix strix TaxID=222440 RepID=A0A5J4W6U2_9EUKA|nr:MAG: hypothetical protein EZS28_014069 [Streblomastix strix]
MAIPLDIATVRSKCTVWPKKPYLPSICGEYDCLDNPATFKNYINSQCSRSTMQPQGWLLTYLMEDGDVVLTANVLAESLRVITVESHGIDSKVSLMLALLSSIEIEFAPVEGIYCSLPSYPIYSENLLCNQQFLESTSFSLLPGSYSLLQ